MPLKSESGTDTRPQRIDRIPRNPLAAFINNARLPSFDLAPAEPDSGHIAEEIVTWVKEVGARSNLGVVTLGGIVHAYRASHGGNESPVRQQAQSSLPSATGWDRPYDTTQARGLYEVCELLLGHINDTGSSPLPPLLKEALRTATGFKLPAQAPQP